MGFLKYLGFALPLSVALDLRKDGQMDGHPSPAICTKCGLWKRETFAFGEDRRICRDDLVDTVRVSTYRVRPIPRTVVSEHPEEIVADQPHQQVPLDPWWDRQLS